MRLPILFCSAAVLTGCAGLNSEFEHSIPAKDSGYWLQQADDMTSKGSDNSKASAVVGSSSYIDVKQYKLINTGNLKLPVKMIPNVVEANAPLVTEQKNIFTPITASSGSDIRYEPYDSHCSKKYCYPEPNAPFREQDRVYRVWLAPYLSPDNNVHLGEIVYFIAKPSKWAGVEK